MTSEHNPPITRQEALSALEEIDRVRDHVRRTLAGGAMAPMLVIWLVGFAFEQFIPNAYRLWVVIDLIGIACSFYLGAFSRNAPVKGSGGARIGVSWLILFGYATLWSVLLYQSATASGPGWTAYGPMLERKMALLWVSVCMFAYVIMGLWLDRFLLWLGALVTAATLVGYLFEQRYFFLWVAAAGGGSLIVSGLFIRKFWKTAHA